MGCEIGFNTGKIIKIFLLRINEVSSEKDRNGKGLYSKFIVASQRNEFFRLLNKLNMIFSMQR